MRSQDLTVIYVLASFLSYVLGLWSATYLQDREIRRRHLGLVRALLAEVRRIYTEVGANSDAYMTMSIFGAKPAVPKLAPWVQGLATDLASTNAAFLPLVMELDRYLVNLAAADKQEDAILSALESKREGLSVLKAHKDFVGAVAAESEVKRAEEAAKRAAFSVDTDFKNVKLALSELKTQLMSNEGDLATALRTHLPWRR